MSNSNNAKAIKSGVWYTASNFLLKAIGFITTPIFTRLLTQAEYGDYNNFTSWLSILTIIATLNMESTISKSSWMNIFYLFFLSARFLLSYGRWH